MATPLGIWRDAHGNYSTRSQPSARSSSLTHIPVNYNVSHTPSPYTPRISHVICARALVAKDEESSSTRRAARAIEGSDIGALQDPRGGLAIRAESGTTFLAAYSQS